MVVVDTWASHGVHGTSGASKDPYHDSSRDNVTVADDLSVAKDTVKLLGSEKKEVVATVRLSSMVSLA